MYKSNLFRYQESSEEESEADDKINPVFFSSAVFQHEPKKITRKQRQQEPEENEYQSLLKPKLKDQKQQEVPPIQGPGNALRPLTSKKQTLSEANIRKAAIKNAYTFKLKSPTTTKKKHDPVSLFQKNSTSWKKDKFLSNRGADGNKEGRKLDLQKRNNLYK